MKSLTKLEKPSLILWENYCSRGEASNLDENDVNKNKY